MDELFRASLRNNGSLFKGEAIISDNPPLFKSQANYLGRFGLLSATEKRKSNSSRNQCLMGLAILLKVKMYVIPFIAIKILGGD